MPKLFAATIALFLLLGAGYGALQAARATPWDCSDWVAFAHDDRTTAILESLAENRGQTLYCGVDQSDTFAKAETWEAGKDRNERDDTVYFGERGQFRGFIAAQEGWLTDGESGITGQSEAVIFEFPKEERRIRRTKRFAIANDPEQFPINAEGSCGPVLGLICSEPGRDSGLFGDAGAAHIRARQRATGVNDGATDWTVDWKTNLVYTDANYNADPRGAPRRTAPTTTEDWMALAETAARRACRARGAQSAIKVDFGPGHNGNQPSDINNAQYLGPGLGIFFGPNTGGANYRYQAWQSRTWSATCVKKIRRNR